VGTLRSTAITNIFVLVQDVSYQTCAVALAPVGGLVKIAKIHVMIKSDLAPRGRNAQTLSGLEGSSNMGCL
jgi:hypothetical protein